jgi:hypothetical protein
MGSELVSRPGKRLAAPLLIYPLCLTMVAMSAIPQAFSALKRDPELRGTVELKTWPESPSTDLGAAREPEAQSTDESLCNAADECD